MINEDKMRDKKRGSSHMQGLSISLMEMIHVMLKYSEVYTDLHFPLAPVIPPLNCTIDVHVCRTYGEEYLFHVALSLLISFAR